MANSRKRRPAGEPRRGSPKITDEQKDKFIEALSQYGNVTHASDIAGFSRNTAQVFRRDDPDFAARFEEALARATDSLEMEAFKRGRDGYYRPVVSMGRVVMTGGTEVPGNRGGTKIVGGEPLMERVVSDPILLRLLQAHHPKYAPVAQRVDEVPKELQPIEKDAEPDEPGPEKIIE